MKGLLRSRWSLLAAIALMRSAGFAFGVLNIDESDYMVFGASILKGYLPYRDLVEIKPPLGYLTYIPAGLFGGMQIWPMRLLGVLWVLATALILREAAKRWLDDDDAGWAAAWLYLLALLCEIPSMGGELMLNLPAAGALYFLVRAWRSDDAADRSPSTAKPRSARREWAWWLLAGSCVGLASLYKHQGAVLLLAFGLALLWQMLSTRELTAGLRALLSLVVGFLIPWLACAMVWAGFHQLPAFIDWVFTKNLLYAGKGSAGSALERGLASTALCVGGTIVPWCLAFGESLRRLREPRGPGRALVLSLWLTWLAVAAGGRFYEHYYLQFAPPLALLGAPLAAGLARRWQSLPRPLRWALALGCALPVLGSTGYSWSRGLTGGYPGQEPRAREVAAFIQGRSRSYETLFVWGHFTPIYVLAQRLPGTRYENTSVHMGNFDPGHLPDDFDAARFRSEPDVADTLLDLQARKPALIVDTAPADIHGWSKIPLSAFPTLRAYIDAHYRLIGTPAKAAVYRRADPEHPHAPLPMNR